MRSLCAHPRIRALTAAPRLSCAHHSRARIARIILGSPPSPPRNAFIAQRGKQFHQVLHKLLGLEEAEVAAKLAEARNEENTAQIRSPLARAYAEAHRRSLKLDALAVSNRARAAKVTTLGDELKLRAEQQHKLSNYRMKVRPLQLSRALSQRQFSSAARDPAIAAPALSSPLTLSSLLRACSSFLSLHSVRFGPFASVASFGSYFPDFPLLPSSESIGNDQSARQSERGGSDSGHRGR